jgi:hypothetical protein
MTFNMNSCDPARIISGHDLLQRMSANDPKRTLGGYAISVSQGSRTTAKAS